MIYLLAESHLNSHDALLAPPVCLFSPVGNGPPGSRDFCPLLEGPELVKAL